MISFYKPFEEFQKQDMQWYSIRSIFALVQNYSTLHLFEWLQCHRTHEENGREERVTDREHLLLFSIPLLLTFVHSFPLAINEPKCRISTFKRIEIWPLTLWPCMGYCPKLNPITNNKCNFQIFTENIMELMFVKSKSSNVLRIKYVCCKLVYDRKQGASNALYGE